MRLFIAIEIPGEIRNALATFLKELREIAPTGEMGARGKSSCDPEISGRNGAARNWSRSRAP